MRPLMNSGLTCIVVVVGCLAFSAFVWGQSESAADEADLHHAALGITLGEGQGGVVVLSVMPGSPAAKAGLHPGDEIRRVDDQRVRSIQSFIDEIRDFAPGTKVDLAIRRDGERQTVTAKLVEASSLPGMSGRQSGAAGTAPQGDRVEFGMPMDEYGPGRFRAPYNPGPYVAGRSSGAGQPGAQYSYPPASGRMSRGAYVQQQLQALQQEINRQQQIIQQLQMNQNYRLQREQGGINQGWNPNGNHDPAILE